MKKWISALSFYLDKHLHSFLTWFSARMSALAVIITFSEALNKNKSHFKTKRRPVWEKTIF